ncbi:MAG TPA: glycosyltransferase family 4 protein [Vitreimonas sp.]|nr:glycosyltransferase family 4 protein [Vitreimonas sp.]
MLTPYLPYPLLSGGQIRTYNLLKKLAKKHDITLFALIKENTERQYIPELEKYCKKVRVFKRSQKPFTLKNILQTGFSSFPFLVIRNYVPETVKAVKSELETEHYDLIHAETFYMMPHLPPTSIPTILVEQTIEYLGYESYAKRAWRLLRPLLNIDIQKIQRWEEYYWRTCEKLIVMSEEDRQFIANTVGSDKNIEVVANGVDVKWFQEKPHQLPKEPTVLSVGTFKWLPNIEAVDFLAKKVWPKIKTSLPKARLWIVGNAPTKEIVGLQQKDTSITVTGGIPDIRDAFKGAHVLVATVFSGKGTRYKILEALASETPVVATEIAVEGLGVENGREVVTSNTPEGLSELTVQVLTDQKLRQSLAKKGLEFVTKNFDWDLISQKLDRIYLELGRTRRTTVANQRK